GAEAAARARQEWEAIHQKKAATGGLVVPADTPTVQLSPAILRDGQAATLDLIVKVGFETSRSNARRLVEEKGFRINGELVTDPLGSVAIKSGDILQRGKRKFVRIELG